MVEVKVAKVPIASHFNFLREDCPKTIIEQKDMEQIPYASVVGSLMYSMVCTRLDLAYLVSLVSKYIGNLGIQH